MILCDFQPTNDGQYRCTRCGAKVQLRNPTALPIRRHCDKPRPGPCLHLGTETRRVDCPSCNGTVKVKVFGCTLLGETTLAKKLDGLACCAGCEKYEAPTPT